MRRFELVPAKASAFSFFDELEKDFAPFFNSPLRDGHRPDLDIGVKDGNFYASVDLPGVSKDDLNVEMNEDVVSIFAQRSEEHRGDHYSEKYYGKISRSFKVPKEFDLDKAEAHFENGVLSFLVPKKLIEQENSKKIDIKDKKEGLFTKIFS